MERPRPNWGTSPRVVGLAATGGILATIGLVSSLSSLPRSLLLIGLTLILAAVVWAGACKRTAGESEVFELGRQLGYDRGYSEGRKIERPTVVKMPERCCSECQRREVEIAAAASR